MWIYTFFVRQMTFRAASIITEVTGLIKQIEEGKKLIIEHSGKRNGAFHYPLSILKQKLFLMKGFWALDI